MLRILFVVSIVLALATAAVAQGSDNSNVQGYVFAAPGAFIGGGTTTGALHLGAGGELFLVKGLAAGAEIGYAAPTRALSDGIGIASFNGSYHFRGSERKWVPFFTGGYSLAFREGTRNLVNFGAGFNYWIGQRHGIRLEVRDHVNTSGPANHLLGVRIAWAFR
jgi:hypothetical protein